MARLSRRLPQNVAGNFYVDSSCIDCETCMIVAPGTFTDQDSDQSFVHRQPEGRDAERRAWMALVACPTASIGTVTKAGGKLAADAARAFPLEIEPGVYYCGYASESSFGASSYLIRRDAGNVLVDSPRAAGPLLERIAALGGVRWLLLTHKDDVADHLLFRERFGCERILHRADLMPETAGIERILEGEAPLALADDLQVVAVPGHTAGSVALLHHDHLFTGDHLWGRPDGRLGASRSVCWYSWEAQLRSLEKLLEVPFRTVLPGHGRPWIGADVAAAHSALRELLGRLGAAAARSTDPSA